MFICTVFLEFVWGVCVGGWGLMWVPGVHMETRRIYKTDVGVVMDREVSVSLLTVSFSNELTAAETNAKWVKKTMGVSHM